MMNLGPNETNVNQNLREDKIYLYNAIDYLNYGFFHNQGRNGVLFANIAANQ